MNSYHWELFNTDGVLVNTIYATKDFVKAYAQEDNLTYSLLDDGETPYDFEGEILTNEDITTLLKALLGGDV